MMTIRERVGQAIEPLSDGKLSAEEFDARRNRKADHAITVFLEAAAEEGWRMRPDEATEEMAHKANGFNYTSPYTMRQDSELMDKYRLMLAAGDKFEWGQ